MNTKEARKRAEEIVGKMTLEEKVLQLGVAAPAIERLEIPSYHYWNEGLHGVARAGTATVFPQAIALAATFDRKKLKEVGTIISTEARAKYNMAVEYGDRDIYKGLTFWSPNVNIFRDPRWGRGHETYGEDPYLTGELGKAFIKGMQGEGKYLKTAACAKHFAVHSGPEEVRSRFNAEVSEKDLNETYLPAFEACIKDGKVEIVMSAYNAINGVPASVHKELFEKIREEWGFEGHVTSDCLALENLTIEHKITKNHAEGLAKAFNSGVDVNCGVATKSLYEALEQKLIDEETITEACIRLYTTRCKLGMFAEDNAYDTIPYEVVECREHLKASYEAAISSFVLLKNEHFLPLQKEKLKTVAVIGPNANNRRALEGNYQGTASRYITVLEGIQDTLGESVRVLYSQGCDLKKKQIEPLAKENDRLSESLKIASMSDVVFLCLGLDSTIEGEAGDAGNAYGAGDKPDLCLPGIQQTLLQAVLEVGKPVILLLETGSALTFGNLENHENLKAIINAWYPGAQGGKALADVLFGKRSPGGKLPVTFYRSTEKLPEFGDYSMKGRTYRYAKENILYPFGYGLTYSKIRLEEVRYQENRVSFTIQNVGDFDVEEAVQIYVKHTDSPDEVENYRLCGVEKVFVKKGEALETQTKLDKNTFTLVNEKGERRFVPGEYQLYVSVCQPDERSIELSGVKPAIVEVEIR